MRRDILRDSRENCSIVTDILILMRRAGSRKEALPSFRDVSICRPHGLANMQHYIPYLKPQLTKTRGDSSAEMSSDTRTALRAPVGARRLVTQQKALP
jgi:hypothetical protein